VPVRFQRPWLPPSEAIERYLALSREARWFTNFGPCYKLLQERLRAATDRPCVPVANATLGLMVAIAALRGRAPSDAGEALVPSFGYTAAAQAAFWNGLHPVFVDIEPDGWHLDPQALEDALRARAGRVAVTVALSSFGVPPAPSVRKRWEAACRQAGVPLVVDSAAGYGAVAEDGVVIGAQGDAEVVSFDALKSVTAGEGGVVFCRDEDAAASVAQLSNFAFDARRQVLRPDGLNAKLSEPATAIALASLDALPQSLAARRQLAEQLLELLPEEFERQAESARGTWQFVPVRAPDADVRDSVLEEAGLRAIDVRTYYDPLHLMPAFAGCARAGDLVVTEDLASRIVCLPMAHDLSSAEMTAIASVLGAAVQAALVS
jgi:dTDP-4-amino-4,6-dideoxygalactose transaminase